MFKCKYRTSCVAIFITHIVLYLGTSTYVMSHYKLILMYLGHLLLYLDRYRPFMPEPLIYQHFCTFIVRFTEPGI